MALQWGILGRMSVSWELVDWNSSYRIYAGNFDIFRPRELRVVSRSPNSVDSLLGNFIVHFVSNSKEPRNRSKQIPWLTQVLDSQQKSEIKDPIHTLKKTALRSSWYSGRLQYQEAGRVRTNSWSAMKTACDYHSRLASPSSYAWRHIQLIIL